MRTDDGRRQVELTELKRQAARLMVMVGLIESFGWVMLVMSFVGGFSTAVRIVLLVLGAPFAGAGLVGGIWIAVKMSKLPKT